nr:immunoglobulin light chain junction region [Macaca mulatta]
CQKYSKTPFTF